MRSTRRFTEAELQSLTLANLIGDHAHGLGARGVSDDLSVVFLAPAESPLKRVSKNRAGRRAFGVWVAFCRPGITVKREQLRLR
jgi:tryptophan synthase alpha subunit